LPIARGQPLNLSDPRSSSGPTRCRSRANAGCRGADHRCRPQSETVNRWVRKVSSCAQTPQLPALRHWLHSDPAASRLPVHLPATLGARPEDCWGTSLPSCGRCHPLTPGLRAISGSADDTVKWVLVASGRGPDRRPGDAHRSGPLQGCDARRQTTPTMIGHPRLLFVSGGRQSGPATCRRWTLADGDRSWPPAPPRRPDPQAASHRVEGAAAHVATPCRTSAIVSVDNSPVTAPSRAA
jgi:hypothetical protein